MAMVRASRLGLQQAGIAAAGLALDAGRGDRMGLVELDRPAAGRTAASPASPSGSCSCGDARVVVHGGVGVGRLVAVLGRVVAARAVHLPQRLGLGVVGRQVGQADRPGRRDAAGVLHLLEVAPAQPHQGRAIEGGVAADPVVGVGRERLAAACRTIAPGCGSGAAMKTALGLQFSASRGRCSPRSRIRIDLPVAASRWASVPPPAPEPMITTSKCGHGRPTPPGDTSPTPGVRIALHQRLRAGSAAAPRRACCASRAPPPPARGRWPPGSSADHLLGGLEEPPRRLVHDRLGAVGLGELGQGEARADRR